MSRLTRKTNIKYCTSKEDLYLCGYDKQVVIQKLGQYEDLEAELGIDLLTLFKALKDGIEVGNDKMRVSVKGCKLVYREEDNDYVFIYDYYLIKLKDYGKYWWLEKPKENDDD